MPNTTPRIPRPREFPYLLAGDGGAAYQEYLRLSSLDRRYADQLLASIRLLGKQ